MTGADRKAIAAAIFDPGATEGLKGERTLTEWQTDAVMRALSALTASASEPEPVAAAKAECCSAISPCSWQRHNGMESVCPTCHVSYAASLVARMKYRVGNPSAWASYDDGASELFREAVAALSASLSHPAEGWRDKVEVLKSEADRAYCRFLDKMSEPLCLGADYKLENGKFGAAELNAHVDARELFGFHRGIHHALKALVDTEPKPADGWRPIESAPKDETLFLAACPPDANFPDGRVMIWKGSILAFQNDKTPDHLRFPATHWMSLPAVPLAAKPEGE